MRKIILLLAIAVSALTAQSQLLWRVSGNGLQKPSYLFGTHHYAPLTVLDSVPEVRRVLADAAQVCGEIDMLNLNAATRATAQAMMLPQGKSLNDFIAADRRAEVDTMLKAYIGIGLDNPVVQRLCPAAVANQLTAAIVQKQLPSAPLDQRLDVYFQTKASKAGKKVLALETVQDQLKLLFGSPLTRQGRLLVCLAENADWTVGMLEMMTDAYMRRDLAAIKELTEQKLGDDCDTTPDEEAAMLSDRNYAWMERLPAMFAEAQTLVVVGVGHFVGDDGLLNLLKKAGYTVEPVDKLTK